MDTVFYVLHVMLHAPLYFSPDGPADGEAVLR